MKPTAALAALETALKDANTGAPNQVDIFVGEAGARMDSDGKAHAYIVLYPYTALADRAEEDLQASSSLRLQRFQATCAGGDVRRALIAVERLQDTVVGKVLAPGTGVVREDGDLGPLRKDLTVSPNRWYAPIDLVVET